ncbi:MAG: hypothetical protein ACOYJ1_07535 [Peptococcales bacterium]
MVATKTFQQPNQECPQLPGTLLRINIPAGTVINLLNLLEITSPSGICLIVRIPVLGGTSAINSLISAVQNAGGKIEIVTQ